MGVLGRYRTGGDLVGNKEIEVLAGAGWCSVDRQVLYREQVLLKGGAL